LRGALRDRCSGFSLLAFFAVNVIGFDDGPFPREHRGRVLLVGAVCAGTRLDGIVSGRVRRDGTDSTRAMVELVRASQFRAHVQAVLLQGIAVGGFNVVDVHELSKALDVPVLVVMRRPPNFRSIEQALFSTDPPVRPPVRGAKRKWRLILQAGAVERLELRASATSGLRGVPHRLWVQRVGLSLETARQVVASTTLHGQVPEPLRIAHLVAGGIATGRSRGRT
jgi:endonuclease V-like protein UPF0215 family